MKKSGFHILFFILAAALALFFSGGSVAVLLVIVISLFAVIMQTVRIKNQEDRHYAERLVLITLSTYIVSSLFFSAAFEGGQTFLMSDPLTYFQQLGLRTMDFDAREYLAESYMQYSNLDVLHLIWLRFIIIIANNYLDGASVLYLTLTNVFFGALSIGVLYRILLTIVPNFKAYRYSLAFALLSQFHFYSVSYVRDIIIAFFFILAIEILLKKYSFKNVIFLFLLSLLIWGFRMFFGVFMFLVTLFYLYWGIKGTKGGRIISYALVLLVLIVAVPAILRSELFELSTSEVSSYQELYDENTTTSGLSNKLNSLPHGAKEAALFVYSQMNPFPFYDAFPVANKPCHYYMATVRGFFAVYWFFISFGLMYMLFLSGGLKLLLPYEKWLLLICGVFILLNSTQTDVRRLMAMYPLLLYFYVKSREVNIKNFARLNINQNLAFIYFGLLVVYAALKL